MSFQPANLIKQGCDFLQLQVTPYFQKPSPLLLLHNFFSHILSLEKSLNRRKPKRVGKTRVTCGLTEQYTTHDDLKQTL